MKQFQKICALHEIPSQGARVVNTDRQSQAIALFRTADDKVYALDDHCPHKGGALSHGLVFGGAVACPLHNFKVDLATGGAMAPEQGQVPCHTVEVRDGEVWLAVS
ncbi:nitrite reductase small subunit NirD [Silvimonas amylolytica]|uniref:Assimilatory nitrite reductase small subunit n=1 Tax=Silvimonas amylolytica TaxID=449663 RepID=A0ABQ2PGZ2_9NEIS|nr:nitrite reductase small subunit NirD [Silvimonas amylolytica]GGP24550.1 assimilatory nitrite reductase small subunit [Silvimonas amylolytica]